MENTIENSSSIRHHKYSVDYCSILVPESLVGSIHAQFKSIAVDEHSRLKDGIEVTFDNLYEFINNTPEFNDITVQWQNFLKECLKIDCDSYIFHS